MMMSSPRFLFIPILYVYVLAAARRIKGIKIHDEFGRKASRILFQKFTVDRENREISELEELITSMSMSMDMGLEKKRKASIPPIASSNVYRPSSLSSSTNTAFGKTAAVPSINLITFDSDSFHKELMVNDIVSTTVADISDDIESSNSASQVNPTDTFSSIKIVMIVCFSLAATILICIIILRIASHYYNRDTVAYIPTFIEHYETNSYYDHKSQADIDSDSDSDSDNQSYSPVLPISAAYI